MKRLLYILIIFVFYSAISSYKSYEVINRIGNRDTIIKLNDTLSLYYASYHPQLKLWYNLHIMNKRKRTKIGSGTNYKGVGSELFHSLSPNAKYVVLDAIIKDYIYHNSNDSVLHENYTCAIIDLKKAIVIKQMQQDCDGSWNRKNQWVSSAGKVIFE